MPVVIKQLLYLTRFDKPIGILLLLWPTLWALWIASHGFPPLHLFCIFVIGTVLMRAAGCAINDIADRHFDAHVKRTQHRPLASGNLSTKTAVLTFCVLGLLAFLLVLQTNLLTMLLSIPAILLAVIYPFLKRFTHWPQAFLGVCFSFGIPMAFAATNQSIPGVAWLFMLANLLWTLVYDTQYAMVDREDDLKIGIKSTAILFGRFDVLIITLLQMLTLTVLLICGAWLSLNAFYYVGIIAACACCIYQQHLIKHRNPQACFNAFINNQWFGFAIFLGIALSLW